jgi:hypothetical protein
LETIGGQAVIFLLHYLAEQQQRRQRQLDSRYQPVDQALQQVNMYTPVPLADFIAAGCEQLSDKLGFKYLYVKGLRCTSRLAHLKYNDFPRAGGQEHRVWKLPAAGEADMTQMFRAHHEALGQAARTATIREAQRFRQILNGAGICAPNVQLQLAYERVTGIRSPKRLSSQPELMQRLQAALEIGAVEALVDFRR